MESRVALAKVAAAKHSAPEDDRPVCVVRCWLRWWPWFASASRCSPDKALTALSWCSLALPESRAKGWPSTRATPPPRSPADVAFMQGMIMHHAQAVEMTALIPSHTENKALRSLGARISSSQSDEIKFMKRWLAARGQPFSLSP